MQTISQKLRTQGFNAALLLRGVCVSIEAQPLVRINVIVQPFPAPADEYKISKETRQFSKLNVLRTHLQQLHLCLEVGDTLVDTENWKRYRIERIADNPQDIKVVWDCDTTDIPS